MLFSLSSTSIEVQSEVKEATEVEAEVEGEAFSLITEMLHPVKQSSHLISHKIKEAGADLVEEEAEEEQINQLFNVITVRGMAIMKVTAEESNQI